MRWIPIAASCACADPGPAHPGGSHRRGRDHCRADPSHARWPAARLARDHDTFDHHASPSETTQIADGTDITLSANATDRGLRTTLGLEGRE
jgi:hypothetical protein